MDKIVEGLGYLPKVVVDERVREIEFGVLDGLDGRGIEIKYPEEVKRADERGQILLSASGWRIPA